MSSHQFQNMQNPLPPLKLHGRHEMPLPMTKVVDPVKTKTAANDSKLREIVASLHLRNAKRRAVVPAVAVVDAVVTDNPTLVSGPLVPAHPRHERHLPGGVIVAGVPVALPIAVDNPTAVPHRAADVTGVPPNHLSPKVVEDAETDAA